MRRLAPLIALLLAGCAAPGGEPADPPDAQARAQTEEPSLPPAAPVEPTESPYALDPGGDARDNRSQADRTQALDLLATRPNLTYYREFGWEAFFNQSQIAQRRGPLTQAWFLAHGSTSEPAGEGGAVVTWMGAPGCEHDPSQPGDMDHGPNWFSENGNRCYLLWSVHVHLGGPEAGLVRITEWGGIA